MIGTRFRLVALALVVGLLSVGELPHTDEPGGSIGTVRLCAAGDGSEPFYPHRAHPCSACFAAHHAAAPLPAVLGLGRPAPADADLARLAPVPPLAPRRAPVGRSPPVRA